MTSQSPSFPFQVLLVFSRISLFSFKSTHLFYYALGSKKLVKNPEELKGKSYWMICTLFFMNISRSVL